MGEKREWECSKGPKEQQFHICDPIYGTIAVYYPVNLIIDTPAFQRLRRISQLGVAHLVYPSADHNRFVHSLGVYHLANKMVTHLALSKPELIITARDRLCVSIAALIHDIGHGPFSHLYELKFLKELGIEFEHEQMSRKIFDYILSANSYQLKQKMDEYLEEVDYEFIKELINPTDFLNCGENWPMKGRPAEKSFLYEIVSNPTTGLDVDKIDYLLRDSANSKVSTTFDYTQWTRFVDMADISVVKGFRRITHPSKMNLSAIFESRKLMHEKVYRHKTVVAAELMYVHALTLADSHLLISAKNGKKYHMSDAWKDVEAFVKLDESIISLIKLSSDPLLEKAKAIFEAIELRQLPKCFGKIRVDLARTVEKVDICALEKEIREKLEERMFGKAEVIVKIQPFDYGMGIFQDPQQKLIQYSNKNPEDFDEIGSTLNDSRKMPGGVFVAYCYLHYKDIGMRDEASKVLKLEMPNYVYWSGKQTLSPFGEDLASDGRDQNCSGVRDRDLAKEVGTVRDRDSRAPKDCAMVNVGVGKDYSLQSFSSPKKVRMS